MKPELEAFLANVRASVETHLESFKMHAEDIFPGVTLQWSHDVQLVEKVPAPQAEAATPDAPAEPQPESETQPAQDTNV